MGSAREACSPRELRACGVADEQGGDSVLERRIVVRRVAAVAAVDFVGTIFDIAVVLAVLPNIIIQLVLLVRVESLLVALRTSRPAIISLRINDDILASPLAALAPKWCLYSRVNLIAGSVNEGRLKRDCVVVHVVLSDYVWCTENS